MIENTPSLTSIPVGRLLSQAIYTEGPLDAEVIVLGEAPGYQESLHGGAFIGPAGELLTQLLSNAGLNRGRCRFENVFQFHPDRDDLTPFIRFNNKGVAVHTEAFENAREQLRLRLLATTANVFIALGNVALYTLTGMTGILKRRGSIYPCALVPGRKVVASIHPSASLRFGSGPKFAEGQRKRAVDPYVYRHWIQYDLLRAKNQAAFPEIRLPQRDLVLEPGFQQVLTYLEECLTLPMVSIDIEATRSLNSEATHVAVAKSATDCMCIPFVTRGTDYWTPDEEASIWIAIATLLEDRRVVKIFQNAAFDVSFLHRRHGIVTQPIEDTMIATAILFPDYPAGLDFLVSIYCSGEPYYKDDGKQWNAKAFGDEIQFRLYNAKDAAVLHEIFPKQLAELERTRNVAAYRTQKRLVYPLTFAANNGVWMNIPVVEQLKEESEKQIAETLQEWNAACKLHDVEVNPDSHPQVTNLFYGILRFPAYRNQGEVTCDDRALRMLILKGSKEAEILLRYRKLSKMHGTYFEMVFDEDQRLRCSYNPVGTEQGRISSSKNIFGTGGNLQNLPAQMTALQLADPGYIMVNQDLAQAENRVVAYVFGEEKMITAFENGVDIHKQTGALIAGVSLEQVTDDIRQDGKRANHGLNYDLGAESFALYYQLQRDVAKRIVDRYHAVYPGVREGHARIRDQLTRNGRTLVNCQGRYRTFLGRWGHDLFKVAYSFIPQSTVGMKMNTDGVCHLFERQDLYPEVVFLNTVHDSILYQIPLSVGPKRIMEIVLSVKASLESPLMWEGRSFSIPTDTAFGFTNNKKTQLNFKATKIKQTALSALCDELSEFTKVAA